MNKLITKKGAKILIEEYNMTDNVEIYICFFVEGKRMETTIVHDDWSDFAEYDIEDSTFYNELDEEGNTFTDYSAWYDDNFNNNKAIELIEYINLKISRS